MRKTFFTVALCVAFAASIETFGAPEQSPARVSPSSHVGYYRTTCGIIVKGMGEDDFASMDDMIHYMIDLNAYYCNGDEFLPEYSADPFQPEPDTETPG